VVCLCVCVCVCVLCVHIFCWLITIAFLSLSLSLILSFPIIRLFSSLQLHSRAMMMWMSKTQFEESDVDAAAAHVSFQGIWVIFSVRTVLSRMGTKE
jgi:hypothetical protein